MKKSVKKVLIIAGGVLAVLILVYTFFAPLSAEVVTLAPQEAQLYFTQQGVNGFRRNFQVMSLVSGRINAVYFSEGDSVAAGQVLIDISASDYAYQIRQLESTIAAYNAQKMEVVSNEAQYKQELETNLEVLRGEMRANRGQRLAGRYNHQSIDLQVTVAQQIVDDCESEVFLAQQAVDNANQSDPDYLALVLKLENAQKDLKAAQRDLRVLEASADAVTSELYFDGISDAYRAQEDAILARLELDFTGPMLSYYNSLIAATQAQADQLREQSGYCSLAAPVSGTVLSVPIADSNLAQPGQVAAVIGVGAGVEVFVPIRDIEGVRMGNPVTLTLETAQGDKSFAGTVAEIEEIARVMTSSLGVEERRVRVFIDTDAPIGVGYNLDVRFVTYQNPSALVVPKTAVFTDKDGNACVWAVEKGKAHKAVITEGMETRVGIVVESGLLSGDGVIKDANTAGLREGKLIWGK